METIFAASEFHPRDRIERWYDVASKLYVGHQCDLDKSHVFDATIRVSRLATIETTVLQSNPVRFIHSQRHISMSEDQNVFLCMLRQGRSIWLQDGREGEGLPGDFAILNACRPYELAFCERSSLLVFKIPLREFEQRVGPTIGLTAITVSADSDLGGLASGFLSMLPGRLPIGGERDAVRIADHALDLAGMALLAATTQRRPTLSSAREIAISAVRRAIDSNLTDANLTTEIVARAAGISVRYASQLLHDDGTSVGRCILERRLEECRRRLADPAQVHRSITEIALSWGFSDPSHFARRFKQAFGRSPREYRQATQSSVSPGLRALGDCSK